MTDKEIGELWLFAHMKNEVFTGWWRDRAVLLIRKLVEERAKLWIDNPEWGEPNEVDALQFALRDFGIDPATWEVDKS